MASDATRDTEDANASAKDASGSGRRRRRVTPSYDPPEGVVRTLTWAPPGREAVEVTASAGWTVLRRDESPAAEVFAVSWVLDHDGDRPVTFVFNGGPGASSAYLHVGTVGPRRVVLPDDGSLPRMPVELVDNESSWLPFTDLVFVDPVGTGFSRKIPTDEDEKSDGDEVGYHTFASDLAAMREFIGRWLSRHRRWTSPVVLAGESYGGYRVGRLARSLQEDEGVGLVGAILVSPALELAPLTFTDYAIEPYLDLLPTQAAGALHHGRSRLADIDDTEQVMQAAAEFAGGDYVRLLARGARMDDDEREDVLSRLADFLGLELDLVRRSHGRVSLSTWVRELLRDRRLAVGLYDATQTTVDPFPDREPFGGADPTLKGTTAAFTMAVNQVLRGDLGLDTERRYHLLSMDVNTAWKADDDRHALEVPPGATDDLRYGLALNPYLQVLVVHGRHDLVTPAWSSQRLVDSMRLEPDAAQRVDLRTYDGGHMFYSVEASRIAFTGDVARFYDDLVP